MMQTACECQIWHMLSFYTEENLIATASSLVLTCGMEVLTMFYGSAIADQVA